ncbi:hypothetical protein H9636_07025 [Ureibacillus sp. Re31]|uniref:Uncharacterized protein n=1 Tax=Ureibacillus galli TaxID=2762222 RepID=A0ABR8XAR8_9BACL|nr:hypothetical protein [Ureibacillus galli]MBD8026409.1 hypothetical protein [Ureibacillus galli]
MIQTINDWLPIVGALCGGLLFIWRITYNLNKNILLLNENIKELNSTTKESKMKINDHEIRIVVLETVTGVRTKEEHKYEN